MQHNREQTWTSDSLAREHFEIKTADNVPHHTARFVSTAPQGSTDQAWKPHDLSEDLKEIQAFVPQHSGSPMAPQSWPPQHHEAEPAPAPASHGTRLVGDGWAS